HRASQTARSALPPFVSPQRRGVRTPPPPRVTALTRRSISAPQPLDEARQRSHGPPLLPSTPPPLPPARPPPSFSPPIRGNLCHPSYSHIPLSDCFPPKFGQEEDRTYPSQSLPTSPRVFFSPFGNASETSLPIIQRAAIRSVYQKNYLHPRLTPKFPSQEGRSMGRNFFSHALKKVSSPSSIPPAISSRQNTFPSLLCSEKTISSHSRGKFSLASPTAAPSRRKKAMASSLKKYTPAHAVERTLPSTSYEKTLSSRSVERRKPFIPPRPERSSSSSAVSSNIFSQRVHSKRSLRNGETARTTGMPLNPTASSYKHLISSSEPSLYSDEVEVERLPSSSLSMAKQKAIHSPHPKAAKNYLLSSHGQARHPATLFSPHSLSPSKQLCLHKVEEKVDFSSPSPSIMEIPPRRSQPPHFSEKQKKEADEPSRPSVQRLSYLEWLAQNESKHLSSRSSPTSSTLWISPQRETTWKASTFTPQKYPIGKGRTGCVYQAIENATQRVVALKIMSKETLLSMGIQKQIKNEISIHSSLEIFFKYMNENFDFYEIIKFVFFSHLNIIKLLGHFEDPKTLFLVLEFANLDSLRHLLRQMKGPLQEKQTAHYIYQIATALEYLHAHAIIHRDIKPENILVHFLSQDALKAASLNSSLYYFGVIKLADMGFACRLEKSRPKRRTVCGTMDYIPPEIASRSLYDQSVDLWCLGVTLYELLVGVPPFSASIQEDIFDKIEAVHFRFPSKFPSEAKKLILQLCQKDASQRLSAKAILTHPWIRRHVSV
ncbi:putative serine/threonine protein kinase ARK2, partial [Cardiosporidium cionae]